MAGTNPRGRPLGDGWSASYAVDVQMTMRGPVDPDELRTLPTSECGILLLRSLAESTGNLHPSSTFRGAEQAYKHNGEPDTPFLLERLSDAWAWLEAHGLLGPDPTQVIGDGARRVTTRGREVIQDPNAAAAVLAEEGLAMTLHPALETRVRPVFALGQYETAAFSALKEVEVRVRNLSGASESLLGVKLMQEAFKPDGGALADRDADGGEQVATMQLFVGAIGTFKNPASHRTVAYEDPTEAAEVILLADLLMRLLDRVEMRQVRG